jgi:hypothetical protein
MIRDILLPRLMERFPGRGLRTGSPPDPIAVFPAAHPAVGEVSIWDDGDEAMVAIGDITHGHFNSDDESLTPEQKADQVAAGVLGFLEDLLADRALLWKSPDGGSGGWRISEYDEMISLMDGVDLTFRWSGPVKNPLAGDPLPPDLG